MELHLLKSPEFENYIFIWWCEYICMFVSVCYQHNSKINDSRKFKVSTLNIYNLEMLLNLFTKVDLKVRVQGHIKEFGHITIHGQNFFLMHFGIFRLY